MAKPGGHVSGELAAHAHTSLAAHGLTASSQCQLALDPASSGDLPHLPVEFYQNISAPTLLAIADILEMQRAQAATRNSDIQAMSS